MCGYVLYIHCWGSLHCTDLGKQSNAHVEIDPSQESDDVHMYCEDLEDEIWCLVYCEDLEDEVWGLVYCEDLEHKDLSMVHVYGVL